MLGTVCRSDPRWYPRLSSFSRRSGSRPSTAVVLARCSARRVAANRGPLPLGTKTRRLLPAAAGRREPCSVSSIPQARRWLPAYPRPWRSRRTAISSWYLIEQTPTSGCIRSSTPTTDARNDPDGSPFAPESGCARPRERRVVGVRPKQAPDQPSVWLLPPAEPKQAPGSPIGEHGASYIDVDMTVHDGRSSGVLFPMTPAVAETFSSH